VVAAHGAVRRALLERQRAFARQPGGAVLDGRDIGTVIAPDAEMKFWIDAEVGERARRRALELQRLGMPIDVAEMLRQLKERDARDAARADAPMRAAPDALTIDTTLLTPEETLARALDWIDRRLRPA
jgi:cytidylate kinase